ncbi:MAG TPA: hypothetical protein VFL14_02165 [Xanthomonadales bacterium]|nr:hypothetical protein [Xanthomonadales bacterium]
MSVLRALRLLASLLALVLPFAASARDWRPLVSPYGELFPSLAIATAGLRDAGARDDTLIGDAHGLVGASVVAARDGERVRLAVRMPGLAEDSRLDATLPRAGVRYTLFPRMRWDTEQLAAWRGDGPADAQFVLEGGDGTRESRTLTVTVRSVNQAPYHVGGTTPSDLNWMFAAYVNERHPVVDRIVAEARRGGVLVRFDGYDSGDPEDVYRQVFALWRVLQAHGIRYSPIARVSTVKDRVLSQYVRFLDESWESSEANCVDGSVLMASLLRRVGLRPSLVLVPGHMFIAFDLDRDGRRRAYLETTLIGDAPATTQVAATAGFGARDADALHELGGTIGDDASFASFERAVEEGVARYSRARNRFLDEKRPQYQIIDIEAARRLGVAAIASEVGVATGGSGVAAPSGR